MLRRAFAKPLLLQGHQVKSVGAAQLRVKPALIDEIAEAAFRGRPFDQFFIPGLG
jgi:hypothetical protein